jgi:hypothetical protein
MENTNNATDANYFEEMFGTIVKVSELANDEESLKYVHEPLADDIELDELSFFVKAMAKRYPDGVDTNYFFMQLNAYITELALNGLIEKELIEEFVDDDGETKYRLTAKGYEATDNLV